MLASVRTNPTNSPTISNRTPSQSAPAPRRASSLTAADQYVAPAGRVRQALPADVARAKQAVLAITRENTTRSDNVAEVRAKLQPHLDVLSAHFNANRPANEVELTRGSWKSLWYDDPDIDSDSSFRQPARDRIWQVVKDDFYYNVSETKPKLFGLPLGTIQSYLKGNYEIVDRLPPATEGGPERRNVIALKFAGNRARLGKLPSGGSVAKLVDDVEGRDRFTLPVPGPRGITGELWNLYVDADIRISAGIQGGESRSKNIDLYILERKDIA